MNNLKKYLTKKEYIIFVIAFVITLASFSYAFFMSTDMFGNNIATTECFKLSFVDSNDITLDKAYPLSEQEGSQLTPYTFTIKNVCNKKADYQVNIETLNTTTLDTEYVRMKLDNNDSIILKRNELITEYVNQNVKEGRKIAEGSLSYNEEVTYNLRLWVDEQSTVDQSENKIYRGKVTVSATPNNEVHDVTIAYIVDGVAQDTPPAKGSGYKIKEINCTGATGEWDKKSWKLLLGDWTGKVTCDLEFEIATDVTVTLYSAALDEVYYYNDNNEKTVLGTTDSTGKLENVTLLVDDITLYSSVANSPNDLSQLYSKELTIESNTEEVYFMPDRAIYWYGYKGSEFIEASPTNGWTCRGYANWYNNVSYKNNYISITGSSTSTYYSGFATKDLVHGNTFKVIGKWTSADGNTIGDTRISSHTEKNLNASGVTYVKPQSTTNIQMVTQDISQKGDVYCYFGALQLFSAIYFYAAWIE